MAHGSRQPGRRHDGRPRRRPARPSKRRSSAPAAPSPTPTGRVRSSPPARWTPLERLQADPPEGARLRPLSVAGAFHTVADGAGPCGARRRGRLRERPRRRGQGWSPTPTARSSPTARRCCVGWSNRSARRCAGTPCMQTLGSMGVTATIELAPAGTLTAPDPPGAARGRGDRAEDPGRLGRRPPGDHRARPRPGRGATAVAGAGLPDPRNGAASAPTTAGTRVQPGAPLVDDHHPQRGRRLPQRPRPASWWSGWCTDGDPVTAGQPLARLAQRPRHEGPDRRPAQHRSSGSASTAPARLVTNDDLPQTLDTNDEWIQQRTGIASRGIAGEGETVITMASPRPRARRSPTPESIPPQVGLVVLATCSMPQSIPGGAAQVADVARRDRRGRRIRPQRGLRRASATPCPPPSDAVRLGTVDYAVVAAAEKISALVDWTDRSSAILFGDGAGAVVVGPVRHPGIGPVVFGSDGTAPEPDRHGPDRTTCASKARPCSAGHHLARRCRPARPARRRAWSRASWLRVSPTRPTCGSSTPSPSRSARPNAVVADDVIDCRQHLGRVGAAGPRAAARAKAGSPRATWPSPSPSVRPHLGRRRHRGPLIPDHPHHRKPFRTIPTQKERTHDRARDPGRTRRDRSGSHRHPGRDAS